MRWLSRLVPSMLRPDWILNMVSARSWCGWILRQRAPQSRAFKSNSLALACASAAAMGFSRRLSSLHLAECGEEWNQKPMWIVADMDRTLVSKPPKGGYPHLKESPCFQPVLRWLDVGGRLCVVTTDGGLRTFSAIWDHIPKDKRGHGRVLICTSDGASLHYGDSHGNLVEDSNYQTNALVGAGAKTNVPGLAPDTMPELLHIARDIQLAWFDDLLVDNTLLLHLGSRDQESYRQILRRVIRASNGAPLGDRFDFGEEANVVVSGSSQVDPADTEKTNAARVKLRELFTVQNLLNMNGTVKRRGSLIWRNQNGPMTKESMIELQDQDSPAMFTSVIVMSVPQEVRMKYIKVLDVETRLKKLGVEASYAPNSIWFKNPFVDKSLPIRYMLRHADQFDFDLRRCIAFGDNPSGNDKPLTGFEKEGMPFVSLAASASEGPTLESQENHVGGFELGTAIVLNELAKVLRPEISGRALLEEIMPSCKRQIASKL